MEVKRQQHSTMEVLEYRKKSPVYNLISWKVTLYLTRRSHELQHARLLCLSLSSKVCSNSHPLTWWCCLTISSSAALFSFCLQPYPRSVSFPMSQLFTSGGQSTGASASASVLPMNIQGWLRSGLTGLISGFLQRSKRQMFLSRKSQTHSISYSSFLEEPEICNYSWDIYYTVGS